MLGWISDERNYSTPVEIGSAMRSVAVGEVVESRHPIFKMGEVVTGWFGWQQFAAVEPARSYDASPRTIFLVHFR
jgi:NADPH-dependent curcumin reductase